MLNTEVKVNHIEHGEGIGRVIESRDDGPWMLTLSIDFDSGLSMIAPIPHIGECGTKKSVDVNLFDLVRAFVEIERMG